MGTATPSDDQVASFSAGAASCSSACRGPDLLAPGLAHAGSARPGLVHRPEQPERRRSSDSYFRGSGTSEAAAFVSGVVALISCSSTRT